MSWYLSACKLWHRLICMDTPSQAWAYIWLWATLGWWDPLSIPAGVHKFSHACDLLPKCLLLIFYCALQCNSPGKWCSCQFREILRAILKSKRSEKTCRGSSEDVAQTPHAGLFPWLDGSMSGDCAVSEVTDDVHVSASDSPPTLRLSKLWSRYPAIVWPIISGINAKWYSTSTN